MKEKRTPYGKFEREIIGRVARPCLFLLTKSN